MATINTKGSNGVSYGYKHEVTAQDVTDGSAIIDFGVSLPLAFVVQITRAGEVTGADAGVTYPATGQVSIADGTTYVLTAGDVISVVAQFARGDV